MIVHRLSPTPAEMRAKLHEIFQILENCGDHANADIVKELGTKLISQKLTVACCGYVSAGKSKLLNTLLGGQELLPVSPLPTSKNFVYLKQDKHDAFALAIKPKDKPSALIPFPGHADFQALCQDETINHLELTLKSSLKPSLTPGNIKNPNGLVMIDTPGIDSLESGRRLAEHPAMLMSDLVLYIMDYNHAESQVNFSFLKSLEQRQIPYLVVVNQIDKHVSFELSLADFRARLTNAFRQWNLTPAGLYLLSLSEHHPESQLEELRQTLSRLLALGPKLVYPTVIRSVRHVLTRHGEFFSSLQDDLRRPHLWVQEQSASERELTLALEQTETQIKHLTSLALTIESEILAELDKLLDNAPLFSFETRELANQVLESRQPGFKAGFFAGSAKTKAEQDKRLHLLYTELAARSEAHLTWHMRTLLASIPSRYNLPQDGYTEEAAQLAVRFEPELLLQTVRPGALVSGEYVLNYTRDLGEAIKSVYRQSGRSWIKRAQELASMKISEELSGLEARASEFKRALKSWLKLRELDTLHREHLSALLELWEQAAAAHPEVDLRAYLSSSEDSLHPTPSGSGTSPGSSTSPHSSSSTPSNTSSSYITSDFPGSDVSPSPSSAPQVRKSHPKLWQSAQALKACADLIKPLPGFEQRVVRVQQRAARLEENLFTVALFGAFSAGKSSLANALLGENVLPVSPIPTTAAINKILPPTKEYPHGTIKVHLKSLADLTSDVLFSLSVCGISVKDLNQALLRIPELASLDVLPDAKPHLSFLQAVARGQAALFGHLGEELSVSFAEFREFVVQEDKACFVESIELYFSCPLTELGVVLVDTPGSNSTNARHTNVSFDYIKNADAVLFVTYYNNPFCKADAQFLSQLGKVKDAFALDKMFFLVNAADLAESPGELELVLTHVEQNLRASDITRPRIFPVSSQLALLTKLAASGRLEPAAEGLYRKLLKLDAGAALPSAETDLPSVDQSLTQSGLKAFETNFYSFIENDLTHLAIEGAATEIQRLSEQVAGLLEAAKTDAPLKEEKIAYYRKLEQAILTAVNQLSFPAEEQSIKQEIDELFYYVNQRFWHRLPAIFDRSFFILAKPKEEQPQQAVQQCLNEFLQDLEIDLSQELRATSLRVEKFVGFTLNTMLKRFLESVHSYDPQCRLQSTYEASPMAGPELSGPKRDRQSFARIPALYKNPRDWVEGQGRTKMREALVKSLEPQVQTWLDGYRAAFKETALTLFEQESQKLKAETGAEISGYYAGLASALGDGYNVQDLEHIQIELSRVTSL